MQFVLAKDINELIKKGVAERRVVSNRIKKIRQCFSYCRLSYSSLKEWCKETIIKKWSFKLWFVRED